MNGLIPLLFGAVFLVPGYENREVTPELTGEARTLVDGNVYWRGKGTKFEFLTNQCAPFSDGATALKTGPGDPGYEKALRQYVSFVLAMRDNRDWPEHPETVVIPFLKRAPVLDGNLAGTDWEGALVLRGEYPLGKRAADPAEAGTEWKLGHDGTNLYVGFSCRDAAVTGFFDRRHGRNQILKADALELFLRPHLTEENYYEILANPGNALWVMRHHVRATGMWEMTGGDIDIGIRQAAATHPTGWSVELSVPLASLRTEWGYRSGPSLSHPNCRLGLMLARTDRNGERYSIRTVRPLLFSTHNLAGYLTAELEEAGLPVPEKTAK